MALPSYYTPAKPYTPPKFQGQQVQNQLYSALSAGNARTPPKPSDMTQGVEQADTTKPGNTVYTPYQQAAPVAAVNPNTHQPEPAQAAASGAGGGGGGGYSFDFSGDPMLARTRAYTQMLVAQGQAAALAQRKAQEIGYGYDPALQYEDQATQEAARQNPFSVIAQLLFGHNERGRNLTESLNKSNLFYSGENLRQTGLEGRQYTLEQTQGQQAHQNAMNQIAKALMDTQLSAQQQEIQAEENAYNRAIQMGLGAGGFGGAGGGGGFNQNDFTRGADLSGRSAEDVFSAAQAVAPTYNGVRFVPNNVAQEGVAPPGYKWVKFSDPTGRQGSDTVLVPIG